MSESNNNRRGDEGGDEVGEARVALSGRTGAIVMRSVSIFLASGRKASSTTGSRRQRSGSSGSAALGQSSGRSRCRRMPVGESAAVRSAAHHAKLAEALRKKTKFSKQELEALCKIYAKLTSGSSTTCNGTAAAVQKIEGIDRTIFRELLHNTFDVLTEDALVERMFSCWDKHSEGAIRLESWITGLDVFLRGTLHEKMEFCFSVYDLNNDGFITKDEIFQLFKNSLMKQPGEEDPEEGVRDLSEMALKKLDVDHDGRVSFFDYEATVSEEPLLLEAFGQVLPTPESATAFLMTLC
ncbi:EF-hand calcium-binding domain-containing protein 1 [Copidosoma floridanum]|uniref:EF-hand calcium-binding domain-containing protein 1 n=1 Tax=Copidosoma floridanum TaxID=29053 RepID=UPI0006C976FF|nr:EF-hand calcium-binding domain-containing protein 1 [Copidosoma floridanum]